jgi:hypothetical protein
MSRHKLPILSSRLVSVVVAIWAILAYLLSRRMTALPRSESAR